MATSLAAAVAFLVSIAVVAQSALGGGLECENLPPVLCAMSISGHHKRCVLDRTPQGILRCRTSGLPVRAMSDWVETDACGVDRDALGLPVASAAAEDRVFMRALCSTACYDGCPNVVDLYGTLAAAEGLSLPALCEAHKKVGDRRMMSGMSPVGAPVGAPVLLGAPAPM